MRTQTHTHTPHTQYNGISHIGSQAHGTGTLAPPPPHPLKRHSSTNAHMFTDMMHGCICLYVHVDLRINLHAHMQNILEVCMWLDCEIWWTLCLQTLYIYVIVDLWCINLHAHVQIPYISRMLVISLWKIGKYFIIKYSIHCVQYICRLARAHTHRSCVYVMCFICVLHMVRVCRCMEEAKSW